jgi:acetyl esterase/lipase
MAPSFLFALCVLSAPTVEFERTRDVIYGRKFGLAMTMDVFTPKKPNGKALIFVVSGGWFSRPEAIQPVFAYTFLTRGYTVFAVVHGSQPKFTLTEIVDDMHRAVRFIRHNAKKYRIDPDKIGIYGASAGGHLSLMMGTSGGPGDAKARDPVDRASSAVQCVACFFPATDFLNWGKPGNELIDRGLQPPYTAAVDYHEFNSKKAMYERITDKTKLREIARKMSPITFVSKKTCPVLVVHGDKDKLVPLQQSELLMAKLKACGVPHKLEVRKGAGHGWPTLLLDVPQLADWFDEHLQGKKAE